MAVLKNAENVGKRSSHRAVDDERCGSRSELGIAWQPHAHFGESVAPTLFGTPGRLDEFEHDR